MTRTTRYFLRFALFLLLAAGGVVGAAWYWAQAPVSMDHDRIDYHIDAGSSPRSVARTLSGAGIHVNQQAFVLLARLTKQDTRIQAGAYEAVKGDSPRDLLTRMATGDMLQARITLIEGWTYKRIRETLAGNPDVVQTLDGVSDAQLLERLGASATSPEGLFYPDTYVFVPGTSDYDILRRAYAAQTLILNQAWAERAPDLPLNSPYDALILASIVEKETGHSHDRARVAGVFINRLRINMALQTDPTVIYGMGDNYQGRLRKKDLQTDTKWNTYTRSGLPPTPIASAGRKALDAVLHPEDHQYLYFVSRGDGTSEFSRNLAAHNRAVAKYILGRRN